MQRKSEKSVKILAARQSKMTFSFVLFAVSVWQAQQEPSSCPRSMFGKGCLPWSLPDQTLQGTHAGYGAGMHRWLADYCSGFLYGLLHCSFSVCQKKKKKRVFFIQASLPFKSFTGFLTTYISRSGSLYWLEGLSVTLQTATLSASCASSQLRHNDCILDPSVSDLFLPSLTCLQWKGS